MKRLFFVLALSIISLGAFSGNYNGFKVSVYVKAYTTEKMKDLHWLDSTWNIISSQIKVDKIYLETHRDLNIIPDETLEQAKKYFLDKGLEVGGGITYTINEMNNFETFCYSNPEHRKLVKEIAEHTAKHFDDFILDDFFFTSCKSDIEIKAKGTKSWTQYRLDLMTEAGQNLVINPAKKVNPKVKVIIKYPNWYDHFSGLGFNLATGPQIFDGVWTGTESRDPSGNQHLQNYESYNIIRYFENLRPGHNRGGWIDSGGTGLGADRYAEEFWLTFFAKAPEISLCAYDELIGVALRPSLRTAWQGQGTSFDYDEMAKPVNLNGSLYTPTTLARVAGYTAEKIDKFINKLGKPIGIKSYKPYQSLGDDFLQNYFGMIGLPMDMYPTFPTDQQVVLLTEQAKYDPDLITKIKAQLTKGGDVIVTTNLLKAIPDKLAEIVELRVPDNVLVNDFSLPWGSTGKATSDKDILVPQVLYHTNDAWETVSAGRPLSNGVSGYPIILRAQYSKGNFYVLTVPNDFGNLYSYPEPVLNQIRQLLSKDLDIRLEGPAKVSLFLYDNGTFIVESFLDEPVTVQLITDQKIEKITDLVGGATYEKLPPPPVPAGFAFFMMRGGPTTNTYRVTLPPHSYKVFQKN
ncbi:permease [Bacteroidia bacterium]|nr:permease [Bacteroidia bacterium]